MIPRLLLARRGRWELVSAGVIIVTFTIALGWGAYFQRDDLVFAEYFTANPPTFDVLFRSWFGHLMPGYIGSVIAFLGVFGLSWPAALVATAAIHAGAFVAVVRCLDATLTPVRANLFAAAGFSLSLGLIGVRLWWSATLNNTFALAVGLAVLGCATRWIVTGRARHLVAALGLYAVALSLSEKNLLFSVHIAAWIFLVVWRGTPLRWRIGATLRAWPLWVGLAALSAVVAVAFMAGPYVSESGSAPGLASSARFILQNIVGGLIPSLFGIDMSLHSTSLLDPRVIGALIVFAVFVVWTVLRSRSNVGVWIFAGIATVSNAVALSRRADMLGLSASQNLRYLLESTALLWLAIGVALVVAMAASPATARAGVDAGRARRVGRVGAGIAAAVVLAVSAGAWVSALTRMIVNGDAFAARAWVTNVEQTLPNPAPPLIDSPIPPPFGIPEMHPYDMVAALLPSLGWRDVDITTSLEDGWIVGRSGVAGPATPSDPDVQFEGKRCTDGSQSISVPEVHTEGRTYVIVDFDGGTGRRMALHYSGGWTTIDRPEIEGRVAVYLPPRLDGDLVLDSQGGALCVRSVTVSDLVPGPRG